VVSTRAHDNKRVKQRVVVFAEAASGTAHGLDKTHDHKAHSICYIACMAKPLFILSFTTSQWALLGCRSACLCDGEREAAKGGWGG